MLCRPVRSSLRGKYEVSLLFILVVASPQVVFTLEVLMSIQFDAVMSVPV